MGKNKNKRKQDEGEAGADQQQWGQLGPDPNFRLINLHPSRPVCAVAVGAHLRIVDYSNGTAYQIEGASSEGLDKQPTSIRAIAFSPDGRHLLTGGDDKALRIWSTQDWSCLATFKAPKKISAAAFTNDSHHVLFADKFGDVLVSRVAATPAGAEAPEPSLLLGHLSAIITSITVSPDNQLVVSTDKDGKVRVNALPEQPLKGSYEIQSYCLGHTSFVTSSAFISAPGGGSSTSSNSGGESCLLVTGSGDGTVKLWDPMTGECLDTYVASAEQEQVEGSSSEGEEEQAGEQQQQQHVAEAEQQEGGGSGDGEDDEQHVAQQQHERPCAAVFCVAASPDGTTVAVAVEGEAGLLLLSCDHQQRKLQLAQKLELPSVAHPCGATFDSSSRLWAVGGVPLQSSKTVHVAVAQRGSSGNYEVCSAEVLANSSLATLESRDEQEEQQLQGARLLSYYSHLKKRKFDPVALEARKKQRNDRKEASRLAELRAKNS